MKFLVSFFAFLVLASSCAFADGGRAGSKVSLDWSNACITVSDKDIEGIMPEVEAARRLMEEGKCQGSDYLGWIDLPETIPDSLVDDIESVAETIRSEGDVLVVIGIGGSYLGARAAISALKGQFANELALRDGNDVAVYFSGCDMSSDSLASLLRLIKGRRVFVNVISKSGTTTEPAIALRILYDAVKAEVGEENARKRFIATTDGKKGALRELAVKEGWKTFVVPDDVGGRFSVLTPVGLLPMAAAGIDVREMLEGAKAARIEAKSDDPRMSAACMYAAVRNALHRKGKKIEILADFDPNLHYFGEWWKQLYGESEGKENKGIYPDSLDYSTDLHSMGQYVQQGERILMETFLDVENSGSRIEVPDWPGDLDGLEYLEGKTLHHVCRTALRGTAEAHREGGVPNMEFRIPEMNEYYLGYMFYTFEYACGVSGCMLGVNPFNQPGVEAYKSNMFRLLGKPARKK